MFRASARLAVIVGALVLAAACGKKGSPLPPIVRIPAAIDRIAVQRYGNDVYVTLTVPALNIDRSMPPDISRVDIYAYTGRTPPPRGRFLEVGSLVTSIPVTPPPVVPPVVSATTEAASTTSVTTPPADATPMGATPGLAVTVVDTLTPDELVEGKAVAALPARGGGPRVPAPAVSPTAAALAASAPLHRYYLAIPFSSRQRPGPQTLTVGDLTLFALPSPPEEFDVAVRDTETTLSWEAGGGIIGSLLDLGLPPEPSPSDDPFAPPRPAQADAPPAPPSGPIKYNVYRLTPLDLPPNAPPPGPALPWLRAKPAPRNPSPLASAQFVEPVEFGIEHCYVVRGVRGGPPNSTTLVEGEPSEKFCFTPRDRFPPPPPAGLVALATVGSIVLSWESSSAPDLGGYLVLRGVTGSATLQPLTPAPIMDATFVDMTTRAGTTYVYAVKAVDKDMNVSAESNRVEDTGR